MLDITCSFSLRHEAPRETLLQIMYYLRSGSSQANLSEIVTGHRVYSRGRRAETTGRSTVARPPARKVCGSATVSADYPASRCLLRPRQNPSAPVAPVMKKAQLSFSVLGSTAVYCLARDKDTKETPCERGVGTSACHKVDWRKYFLGGGL